MYRFLTRVALRTRVAILCFHGLPMAADRLDPEEFSFEEFRSLVDDLSRTFRILPLLEAVDELRMGCLAGPTIVLTFDDGYRSWSQHVLDYLVAKGIRATFFVTTGQLQARPLWNMRIEVAVHGLPEGVHRLEDVVGDGQPIDVATTDARVRAVRTITGKLKYWSLEKRDAAIARLERQSCTVAGAEHCIRVQDLQALLAAGMELGAHSVNHPILTSCEDAEAEREILQSRIDIERVVGARRIAFAYPNGIPGVDFVARHVEMVRSAGYAIGLGTHTGIAGARSHVFELPRFTPWSRAAWSRHASLALAAFDRQAVSVEPAQHWPSILMVAFHFPPQAGSSGVLRGMFFASHLDAEGWRVQVLSASANSYERTSSDLFPQLRPGIQVERAFAFDAKRSFSIAGKYPELLALPDRWSSWCLDGIRRGVSMGRRGGANVVWSTYPVISAHVIGGVVARVLRKPWVAEFRDPVLYGAESVSRGRRFLLEWLERWVLTHADHCVVTTAAVQALFVAQYPAAAGKVSVIENGYDEEAFTGLSARRHDVDEDCMLLLHSGAIYTRERDPSVFFSALAKGIELGILDARRLRVRFRAPGDVEALRELAVRHGVDNVVDVAGPLPYREAIAEMLGADVLLVFQGTAFNRQIPAKIYEYMRALRPILALVDLAGETATRLATCHNAICVDCQSMGDTLDAIAREWQVFEGGVSEYRSPARDLDEVRHTSRQAGAVNLAGLLASLAR